MIGLIITCVVLTLIQVAAALPWLLALDVGLRGQIVRALKQAPFHLAWIGAGVAAGFFLHSNSAPNNLIQIGRAYFSVLHLQLAADFFVGVFWLALTFWPKGGAVGLSAFREGIRQPMYWLLTGFCLVLLAISPIIPYFTFEGIEEQKMVKEIGYAFVMLFPAIFAVLAASMSISEEIEGRTAITLMSKPVSRRQFLLGKFGGILLAALFMTLLLGWALVWIFIFKRWWEPPIGGDPVVDPLWTIQVPAEWFGNTGAAHLVHGMFTWVDEAAMALP